MYVYFLIKIFCFLVVSHNTLLVSIQLDKESDLVFADLDCSDDRIKILWNLWTYCRCQVICFIK